MRSHVGSPVSRALRASIAAIGLAVCGALAYTGADAQAPAGDARIDSPANDAEVDGVVEIRGRATAPSGKQFAFYRLLIGPGRTAGEQRPIGPAHEEPVESGVLGTWDTHTVPFGEYLLTLRVYATDNSFASASVVLIVKVKPTPTSLGLVVPRFEDVPTLGPDVRAAAPAPVDAPPQLDVVLAPIDDGSVRSSNNLAPIPTISANRAAVPIQGIPLDPNNPGPFAVDTPTTYSPGQLPGAPAPVYITPIDFTISTP
jgi:hypothetical protein